MAAAAVAWDESLRLEASCARCDDQTLRRRWGCEREAVRPVMHLPCWYCDPERPRSGCDGCGGTGMVPWYRCPHSIGADAAEAITQVHLVEAGINPWPVSFSELPVEVVTTFRLASARRGYYVRRERRLREGKSVLAPHADRPDTSPMFRHRWPGGTKQ